jgi:hypothetical protein
VGTLLVPKQLQVSGDGGVALREGIAERTLREGRMLAAR